MCGLAGIFWQDGRGDIDRAVLQRMTDAIRHRGPDGEGFHVEAGLGLGHRRLAIIDVRGGHQPMYNEDESVTIVFNGEIYNHVELRERLVGEGHVFRSHCDTEAIVHAWESWGPDCVSQLSGMFAFALWDRNQQLLFLARDRLGKKPLYYSQVGRGQLAFASELAALAQVPGLSRRIDPVAVDDFFALGYVPDPGSIYEGIHKLPPAHWLLVGKDGTLPSPKRYWTAATEAKEANERDAVPVLIERLRTAVQARLISDVPLGAFLSGGVDSGAVVALAAGLRQNPLSTFTIGFEGAEDERPLAQLVACRYATEHHEDTAARVDYIEVARDQARIFGEPFGDTSAVPTLSVCALARQHATVALSGDGGDEVLGGYRRYRWHRIAEAVRSLLPAPVRRRAIGELARIYPKLDRAPRWLRAKNTLTEISLESVLGYYRTICKIHHEQRRAMFSPAMRVQLDGHDPSDLFVDLMERCGTDDPLRQAQFVDINTYLPGDILTKVDRTSMAVSLEVRAPLLDFEFVDWGLCLPSDLKLRGREGKYLLKRAMRAYLPQEILSGRKRGFATSLASRLSDGADRIRARLLAGSIPDSGIFQMSELERLIDEHAAGAFDHSTVLWSLLVFEGFLAREASEPLTGSAAIGDMARMQMIG